MVSLLKFNYRQTQETSCCVTTTTPFRELLHWKQNYFKVFRKFSSFNNCCKMVRLRFGSHNLGYFRKKLSFCKICTNIFQFVNSLGRKIAIVFIVSFFCKIWMGRGELFSHFLTASLFCQKIMSSTVIMFEKWRNSFCNSSNGTSSVFS